MDIMKSPTRATSREVRETRKVIVGDIMHIRGAYLPIRGVIQRQSTYPSRLSSMLEKAGVNEHAPNSFIDECRHGMKGSLNV